MSDEQPNDQQPTTPAPAAEAQAEATPMVMGWVTVIERTVDPISGAISEHKRHMPGLVPYQQAKS